MAKAKPASDQQVSNTTYVLKQGARSLIKTLSANARRRRGKKRDIMRSILCNVVGLMTLVILLTRTSTKEINTHFRYQRNDSVQSVRRLNRAIKNN